ncbi:MAG TPA: hypothetical protein VGJ04_10600 [Pirellulales bacterium]|jgi:hypothetical protein
MSIASLSFAAIGAGTPLPQSKGADANRAIQEVAAQKSQTQSDLAAERAAGVGETDGNEHEIEDREADGRLPWALPAGIESRSVAPPESSKSSETSDRHMTGQCGKILDLTG